MYEPTKESVLKYNHEVICKKNVEEFEFGVELDFLHDFFHIDVEETWGQRTSLV